MELTSTHVAYFLSYLSTLFRLSSKCQENKPYY